MLKDLAAGTNGGFAITIVGHPFDTMKVRLQTQPTGEKQLYSGLRDCVTKTLQWEGPSGFYRGVASPMVGNSVFNATQFLAYGQAKVLVAGKGGDPDGLTIPQYFMVGAMTGLCVSFVESPIDLFKSQVQAQIFEARNNPGMKPRFSGVFDCVRFVVSNYGLRGFYYGLGATMLRDIPAVSLYFGAYEWTRRKMLAPGQELGDLSAMQVGAAPTVWRAWRRGRTLTRGGRRRWSPAASEALRTGR